MSLDLSVPVFAGSAHRRTPSALPSAIPAALPFVLLPALLFAMLTAQAQPAVPAARPDPLDPKANVPALHYETSLAPGRYRRLGDDKPVAWRDANDAVARIGGWRTYAREAQQPDPALAPGPVGAVPVAKPNDTAKPMPQGHGGHTMP